MNWELYIGVLYLVFVFSVFSEPVCWLAKVIAWELGLIWAALNAWGASVGWSIAHPILERERARESLRMYASGIWPVPAPELEQPREALRTPCSRAVARPVLLAPRTRHHRWVAVGGYEPDQDGPYPEWGRILIECLICREYRRVWRGMSLTDPVLTEGCPR